MGMNDWIYRLKYKDADGTLTEREIEIKAVRRGDKPSNTYIHAFCHLADGVRTFRLDRVRALYLGNEKITDLMEYLTERFADDPSIPVGAEALAAEALNADGDPQPTPAKPEYKIKDIPTAKKHLRVSYIMIVALVILGFVSLPTVVLPILFFGGAGFLLLGAHGAKKQIKKLEAEAAAEVKPEVNTPPEGQ
jgi:hypothetical protein